jgi:hypothetical protein
MGTHKPKKLVVMGIFDDVRNAEHAIANLVAVPVARNDIGIIAHPYAVPHAQNVPGMPEPKSGAMVATAGMAATLVGIALCAIPLAGLLTAGPLVVLGGAASLIAAQPGSPDALEELGVPRSDAKLAVECMRRGGIVIVAPADRDRARRVADAMAQAGPIDFRRRVEEWESEGWTFEPNGPLWTREEIERERMRRQARVASAPVEWGRVDRVHA